MTINISESIINTITMIAILIALAVIIFEFSGMRESVLDISNTQNALTCYTYNQGNEQAINDCIIDVGMQGGY